MNIKSFFVAALSSALELGVATPDDVIRHVTPDVLSQHLPRPLWARLLTACLGAARVDAQLVVETIGVPNLCEHVPSTIIWACVAEIGARALGGAIPEPIAAPVVATKSQPIPLITPPPPDVIPTAATTPPKGSPLPSVLSSTIPAPGETHEGVEDRTAAGQSSLRARTTSNRFRQSNTGIGRLASTAPGARRPQAQAAPPDPPASSKPARRGQTEADAYDVETDIKDDWKNALAVEDEQLVDWSAADETLTVTDDYSTRKR